MNKDLINIWKHVRSSEDSIIALIKKFKTKFEPLAKPDKVAYCRQLTSDIQKMSFDIVRATTYLLLKYCAYMGNFMQKGKYYFQGLDLELHKDKPIYFLSEKYFLNLTQVHDFMKSSSGKIYNKDYKFILKKAKKGDFVFLDPPYIESHDYSFNYNQNEILDNKFIVELATELKALDQRGVKWVMTQADTPVIRKIFKKYQISSFPVFRGYTTSYTNELVIKN